MPITTIHPEYEINVRKWCKIDNVLNGYAKQYVPDVEPLFDRSHPLFDKRRHFIAERSCRLYRESGIFINFALQTLNAITALALNAPPTKLDIPPDLDYLQKDVTGNNLSLDQLIQTLINNQTAKGRIGLFTDFPMVDPSLDKATQTAMMLGPRMYVFSSEAIYNWNTRVVNGIEMLSLVTINKWIPDPNPQDIYCQRKICAKLVLRLDNEGYYQQSTQLEDESFIVPWFYPLANGKKLRKIPFTFVGSEDNTPKCDRAPLETIVELNIGHLRNSCAFEDNMIKYSRGTLVVESSIPDFADYYATRPLVLGTDEGYFVGANGSFTIVQLQPASAASAAMDQKQEQLIMAGAHIVVSNPTNISAETIKLNMGEKLSLLNTIVGNCEDALNEHFGYCDMFKGRTPQDIYIKMSREFLDNISDPLVMAQLLAAMNGGAIPKRIYLAYMQSVGLIGADEDLQALGKEAENDDPLSNFTPDPVAPIASVPTIENKQYLK